MENEKLLNTLLIHELRLLFNIEFQIMEVTPIIGGVAKEQEIKSLIENNFGKAANHRARLEQIAKILDFDIQGAQCNTIRTLIHEMEEMVITNAEAHQTDMALIQAVLRLQKYKISRYKCALYLAMQSDCTSTALDLHIILNEEKKTDALLTKSAIESIYEGKESLKQLI